MNATAQQVQAQTVARPKRWPLVQAIGSRDTSIQPTFDARLVNAYAELDPQSGDFWVYKRPGLYPVAFATAGNKGVGMYSHPTTGALISAWYSGAGTAGILVSSAIHSGTGSIGAITLNATIPQLVSFDSINSSPQTIIVTTGSNGYLINTSAWTVSSIVDANFPNVTVPGVIYLDGTVYVMDPTGNIWNSTVAGDNGANWTPATSIRAGANADGGMALAKSLNYLIALKQNTTQIFYDAGNSPGSPLSPVPDAQLPIGCLVNSTVQTIDNTVIWLAGSSTSGPQIARLDNLVPKIVSTPAVERVLTNASWNGLPLPVYLTTNNVWAWTMKLGGHRFYGLTLQASNVTLVYDLDQDLWYFWTDLNGNYWPYASAGTMLSTSSGLGGYTPPHNANFAHFVQSFSGGTIYQTDIQSAAFTDFGQLTPVDIYTPNFDGGSNRRKYLKTMYFNGDQQAGSVMTARFTDDDYQHWSNPRQVDFGETKPRLTDCGTFIRRRAYHFRHAANTPFRIKSVELQMDIGTL